jgi:hypothetical protein
MASGRFSFEHRPDPERSPEVIRCTFDLVSAFLGGGDAAALGELERLMNEDTNLAMNVLHALTILYASEVVLRAEREDRSPNDVLLSLERALKRAFEGEDDASGGS